MPGEWLPKALADIVIALLSTWQKTELNRADIIESWGLLAEDDRAAIRQTKEDENERNILKAFDQLERAFR